MVVRSRIWMIFLLFVLLAFTITGQEATEDPAGADVAAGTITAQNAGTLREVAALEGHTATINTVAFSPDGTLLASTSDDASLRTWDLATNTQVDELYEHATFVKGIAFNPAGDVLVSTSWDRTMVVYDVAGQALTRNQLIDGFPGILDHAHFSPDGTQLGLTSGNGSVVMLDTGTLSIESQTVYALDNLQVTALAFSPDSTLIAAADGFPGDTARVWALHGEGDDAIAILEGHAGSVTDLVFSPIVEENTYTIATVGDDGTVRLWELTRADEDGETMIAELSSVSVEDNDWYLSAAISKDGTLLATGTLNGEIYLWDASDRAAPIQTGTLMAHAGGVNTIAFSTDGTQMASGGDDGVIKLWAISE